MLQKRDNCVICDGKLITKYEHRAQPITYCPKPTSQVNEDIFEDLIYGVCEVCESVQLMTLIDQAVLYADPHNITYNTPTWAQHHKSFADFIIEFLPKMQDSIIEVGGSSGILATLLLGEYTDYSILDFCKSSDMPTNINFIQGNCETYNFPKGATIIMSHLFEHLYNPKRFIKHAADAKVPNIIISVPNLEALLDRKPPAIVNQEHTYYYDKNDLEYMFSSYGYRLKQFSEFGKHSLFMMFSQEGGSCYDHLYKSCGDSRGEKILQTFRDRDERFGSTTLDDNAIIVPAGMYGQVVYTHAKHAGSVAGFLDNDRSKQGRRLYGTNCEIFSFDKLLSIPNPKIYMNASFYAKELTEQILAIHSTATIINL